MGFSDIRNAHEKGYWELQKSRMAKYYWLSSGLHYTDKFTGKWIQPLRRPLALENSIKRTYRIFRLLVDWTCIINFAYKRAEGKPNRIGTRIKRLIIYYFPNWTN